MKSFFRFILLFSFALGNYYKADATHLIGGTIGYDYIGPSTGNLHTYRVRLTTYQDCNSINWWDNGGTFPLNSAQIGIYEGALLGNNIQRVRLQNLILSDSNLVRSGSTDSCFIPINNFCIYRVDYEATVQLPFTNTGYHFVYDVCCRGDPYPVGNGPNNISLQGSVGNLYHAWTGPTSQANSSPVYDTLDPYLCINDTNQTLRLSTDPNGDSLIYRFIVPYDGAGNNAASSPPNFINYPFVNAGNFTAEVNYILNHSLQNPFGPGSFASINPLNGKAKYFGTSTGIYVLAIQSIEYSSAGFIIGVSNFEFQYIIAPCLNRGPKNTEDPTLTGSNINYNIEEGDTLCINVEYFDPDSFQVVVGLESDSNIFNSLFFNPPATAGPLQYNANTAISSREVCWITQCGMGRSLSYEFTSFAIDSGCPNRSADNIYKITIDPFDFPSGINGSISVCPNQNNLYQTDSIFGTTYTWSVTNGTILNNTNKHFVNILWSNNADSGTVTLNAISRHGCTSQSKILKVDIRQMQAIEAGSDSIICGSDTVRLGGNPTGPSFYQYSWNNSQYLSNDSVTNPFAYPDTVTKFLLTAFDTTGCFITDSVIIDITIDNLTAGPDLYVCPGDSVQIVASGATTYLWKNTATLTDSAIANPIAFPLDTTFYALTGILNNCVFYDTLRIDVDSVVPSFLPETIIGCFGVPTKIGGSPTAPKYTTFQWLPNYFLSSDTAANPISTSLIDTTYFLEVFNGSCFGYDTLRLIIDSLPHVDAGKDTSICDGAAITLNGIGDNLKDFIWRFNDTLILDSVFNPTLIIRQTEKLFFTGINQNGCQNTDSINLNWLPLPHPQFPDDTLLCFGDTLFMNVSSGASFVWKPSLFISDSSAGNPKIFPDSSISYTLNIIGNDGCFALDTLNVIVSDFNATVSNDVFICPGDTTQLLATGGLNYLWTDSFKLSNNKIANPLAYPAKTTNFKVTISDSLGCTKTDSILVEVSGGTFLTKSNNSILCYGDSTTLFVNGLTNVIWSPTAGLKTPNQNTTVAIPLDSVFYTVTGTDSNNCQNTDTVFVEVLNKIDARAGSDVNICAGDTAQIGDNFISGYVYSWSPANLLTNPLIPNPKAFNKQQTAFVVTVSNQFNCSWKDTVNVNIFNIKAPDDTLICADGSTRLNVIPQYGNPPYAYKWSPGTNLSDSTSASPILINAISNIYTIIVTDSTGCSDTTISNIVKANKPLAEITPSYFPSCEQMEILLSNTSQNIDNFFWVINSDTTFEDNPYIKVPYTSPTEIQLIVSALEGCVDTAELSTEILLFEDYIAVDMPNIFTPNGDGYNDFFEFPVENKLMACTQFDVYNRWGALIFSSQGNIHSWDGRSFDGQKAPDGVYFYTLKINSIEWKGSITLLR